MDGLLIFMGLIGLVFVIGTFYSGSPCGCGKGEWCDITKKYRPSWEVANEKRKHKK